MTKAERIIHLIGLIRAGEAESIEDLSRKCNVSQRTIYRDIESLHKMNIPVYFEDGYQLRDDADLSFLDMEAGDAELLVFCLRNNPLSNHPYFRPRLERLKTHLEKKAASDGQRRLDRLFVTDDISMPVPTLSKQAQDILDRFIQAILDQRVVALAVTDRAGDGVYIPLAVRVAGPEARLILTTSMDAAPIEIPVEQVSRLTLTQSTFERRPIELLPADRRTA